MIDIKGYLVISVNGIVRTTKSYPSLDSWERVIELQLNLPDDYFQTVPVVKAKIKGSSPDLSDAAEVTEFDSYEMLVQNLASKGKK